MVKIISKTKKKENGIYYTPEKLAEFLAKPLINSSLISVFDPAYGDGSLLLAGEKIYKRKFPHSNNVQLFGCDIIPVNGQLTHLPKKNFVKSDFFDYPIEKKHDIILMNPPYVRHHTLSDSKREQYQLTTKKICKLNLSADLWAYFLVKAVNHLKIGGSCGAILPWSFLQADYAISVRKYLIDNFQKIKVLALGSDYFDNADERIIMLWLNHFGSNTETIEVGFSQHINNNVKYEKIALELWTKEKIIPDYYSEIINLLKKFKDNYSFQEFRNFAVVKIGVVAGADDFFIINNDNVTNASFNKKDLIPIIASSSDLKGFQINGKISDKSLLILTNENKSNYKSYIDSGKKKEYHLRAHSLRRNPWFSVDLGLMPDAFFPYRSTKVPYLTLNVKKYQCTNSIHRIYFKDSVSEIGRKWIQVSLLTAPAQLYLESFSKIYGSGALKIEPKTLYNTIVFKSNSKDILEIYDTISNFLNKSMKNEAVELSTNFIAEYIKVPAK